MFDTIIWATDGSELADSTLPLLTELADLCGSKIVAVHADEALQGPHADESPMHAAAEDVRAKIAGQVDDLRHAGFATADLRPVASGCHSTARLIADAASEFEADLIVVASDGHRPLVRGALGGVSLELLSLAPCPVLAVPELPQCAVRVHDADAVTA